MRRGALAAILAVLVTTPAHAQVVSEVAIGAQFQRSGGVGTGGPFFQAGLRLPIADRLAARVGALYAFSPNSASSNCPTEPGLECPRGGHRHLLGLDAAAVASRPLKTRSGLYAIAGASVIDGGGNNRFQTERTLVPNVGAGLWSGAHAVELSYRLRGNWSGAPFHFVALTYSRTLGRTTR